MPLETYHETGYLKYNLVGTSNGIPNEIQTEIRVFIKHAPQILRLTERIRFPYAPRKYGHMIVITISVSKKHRCCNMHMTVYFFTFVCNSYKTRKKGK
jgi:hypothetical protein